MESGIFDELNQRRQRVHSRDAIRAEQRPFVDDARKVGHCDVLYSSSHRNEG